jgi:hypothetical protein
MTENKEKSAIDTIYSILEHLKKLDEKVTIMDSNIKLLNNKIMKSGPTKVDGKATIETVRTEAPIAIVPQKKSETTIDNVKIFGRIKNKQAKPIKGIDVNIYDKSGKNIKSRITDGDGYWEARIPSGDYGIEYDPAKVNKKLRPVNFKVTVAEGIKELDISEINK